MRVQLFDKFTLEGVERSTDGRTRLVESVGDGAGVRRTKDGYLTANAKVARTGIQVYGGDELGKPELDLVKVYRPPEEVFEPASMRTAAHRPLTLLHPPKMVDSDNWGQYAKGQTGDKIVRDGDHIQVPLVLMDGKTIKAIDRDGIKELSAGYTTEIVWEPGATPTGEAYDARQTKIEWNHLALVPEARGGPTLRLGDGSDDAMKCQDCGKPWMKDAKACDCGSTKFTTDQKTTETRDASRLNDKGKPMHTIMFDGHKLEVADELTGSTITKREATLVQRISDAEAASKKAIDDARAAEGAHAAALDALRKEIATKDGQVAALTQQVKDAQITPEKLDILAAERSKIIDAAKPLLPKEFAFPGKTNIEIQRAAVAAKLTDADVKDWSVEKVEGAFQFISNAKVNDGTTRLAGALSDHNRKTHDASTMSVADAAYAEMIKEMQAGRTARN